MKRHVPMSALLALVAALMPAVVRAVEPASAAEPAAAIAPYLDESTFLVVHADLARVAFEATFRDVLQRVGMAQASDATRVAKAGSETIAAMVRGGGKDVYAVCSLADVNLGVQGEPVFLIIPTPPQSNPSAVLAAWKSMGMRSDWVQEAMGGALFVGHPAIRERLRTIRQDDRPELAAALTAAGESTVQAIFTWPKHAPRVIEEMLPRLPPALGGAATRIYLQGVQWAALGVELPPHAAARLTIQAADRSAAEALQAQCAAWPQRLAQMPEVKKCLPEALELAPLLVPRVAGDRLLLDVQDGQPAAARLWAIFRGAAQRKP